jgi:MinD superfamily P-loop ATPase
MKIAVLSGKGGTGKTTVAASLAQVIDGSQYVDCDVEEPNGFFFLHPVIENTQDVTVLVPEINPDLCTLCGACARICQFNALAVTRQRVLVFPELCHHCGACSLVCEPGAITEKPRRIGVIESDIDKSTMQGRLDVGEPVGVPIITELKKQIKSDHTAVLDCSPGASCAVVRSLDGCDFALLVTEPTPFGLHDLKIAAELVRQMQIRSGVVLNKSGTEDAAVEDYCRESGLPILMRIPFSREIAESYSRGVLPVGISQEWVDRFRLLAQKIEEAASAQSRQVGA